MSFIVVRSGLCMYAKYKSTQNSEMSGRDFVQLYSGKANDTIPVYKYRSEKTGLTVAIAQVEGPLVNGFFCLGQCEIRIFLKRRDSAQNSF